MAEARCAGPAKAAQQTKIDADRLVAAARSGEGVSAGRRSVSTMLRAARRGGAASAMQRSAGGVGSSRAEDALRESDRSAVALMPTRKVGAGYNVQVG